MDTYPQTLNIHGTPVPLKNLGKPYGGEADTATKGDVIDYYVRIAPYLLPHIYDKPFCMIHFPHGVRGGKSFYQKERPPDAPAWLKSVALPSTKRGEINWCLVNNAASIAYMAGRSVIEMHTWFSRLPDLSRPDVAVIDLDPSGEAGFGEARQTALLFRTLLSQLKLRAVPKTSGGQGIHIYIPIAPVPFGEVQSFLKKLCQIVADSYPHLATLERTVGARGSRIYLDAVQNAHGKTIAAPYSLRAKEGLPVSAPLLWEELDNPELSPLSYNIYNIWSRLKEAGDPMGGLYESAQELPRL